MIKRVKDLLGMSSKEAEPTSTRLVTPSDPPSHEGVSNGGQSPAAAEPDPTNGIGSAPPVADATKADSRERLAAAGPPVDKPRVTVASGPGKHFEVDQAVDNVDQQSSSTSASRPAGPEVVNVVPIGAHRQRQPKDSESPVFEIDEEWFGGALEEHRSRQSTEQSTALQSPPSAPITPLTRVDRAAHRTTATTAPGIADSFHALLAEEQGVPLSSVPPEPVLITDDIIERIATRVVERLSETLFVDTVRREVGNVAERLVREEIARIRARVEEQKR